MSYGDGEPHHRKRRRPQPQPATDPQPCSRACGRRTDVVEAHVRKCNVRGLNEMQLAQLWREHLQAGCPTELQGTQIAGSDIIALDAEVTACVSALITRACKGGDERTTQRLKEIRAALERSLTGSTGPLAEYFTR